MLTLPLEPTDDRANPVFKDAAACALWLSQLQLTNLQRAHSQLLTQVNEFNRYPMRGLDRLNTLESLRETVSHVQADLARKLIAKSLPLNEIELMTFHAIVQLWQAMVTGYQRGLQACIAGEKQLAEHAALLCQRCLFYSGLEIIEHLRTGYEFDSTLWHQLHELYGYAEHTEIQHTEIADPLDHTTSSCSSSYVRTLLFCHASPAQLTRWQLLQLHNWLRLWSNTVTVEHRYSVSKQDAQPLAVDLSGTTGLQGIAGLPHHQAMRYLAMVPLSKLLRVKTILLQQGQTPQQTGLGDESDSHACLELLTYLHHCWCENKEKRSIERRPVSSDAQLCYKPEGIYAHMTGKPMANRRLDTLALKQIATLGHTPAVAQHGTGYPLETWQMVNKSIMGAHLIRADLAGERISGKQLIAVRESNSFTLGVTVWERVNKKGPLKIGIRFLPGQPEPVRIHPLGINPASLEQHAEAFMLPALAPLRTPASLILPRGWLQPNRRIEISPEKGEKIVARLGFSVECGLDYERVSFTPVPH